MIKKIYLETDEEITSVIDKLKNVEEKEVSLVFPKESGLLQSIINLKLLKRQAESMGKNIAVITADRVGRNLAERVGLPVSDHVGSRKEHLPKKIAESQDKVPIEFRSNPKEQEEEEDDISFKKESLKDKDEELSVKESEEIGTDKGGSKEERETIKDSNVKVKDAKDGTGSKKFKLKFPLKKFGVFVTVTFIGLFVFGYIYVPKVNIKIAVATEKIEFDTEITADKNEKSSDIEKGILAADFIEFNKEGSKKYNATGKKNIGTKATGTITVSNTYSTTAQTLVAGTRFSAGGLIFTSTANATVPGYTDPGGGIEAGSVNISVQADDVGSNYNVSSSSDFLIVAFEGTDKDDKITGSNSSAFTGGDSREATVVSAADINKAKNEFSKEIVELAKEEAREKAEEGKVLLDEVLKVEIVETSVSPGLDEEVAQFTVTIKVEVKALAYSEKELESSYKKQAEKEGMGLKQLIRGGYDEATLSITNIDMENGTFVLGLKSDIFLSSILDSNAIKDEIIGQTSDKSEGYILGLEGVQDVDFDFMPSFVKRVPRIRDHITIEAETSDIEEDEDTESMDE